MMGRRRATRRGDREKHRDGDYLSESPRPSVSASVAASDRRILLWDIDGTLIRSTRVGAFKEYTIPVLESVFGTAGCLPEMQVSGMTDLQIVGEALRLEGITEEHIRERIDDLRQSYMEEMKKATGNGEKFFELLPGVREALTAVSDHPKYESALLTGNIEPAAQLKMELMGLTEFFTLPGAFGDESHNRNDLPAIAAERIQKYLGLELDRSQFIVIGDTPNDIACARHFGARAVGVGTGRLYTAADLIPCEPDALLPDLSDAGLFMEMLARL
jgi:phosphoglycolate phosphatase-like HAD superfamily hydrolase